MCFRFFGRIPDAIYRPDPLDNSTVSIDPSFFFQLCQCYYGDGPTYQARHTTPDPATNADDLDSDDTATHIEVKQDSTWVPRGRAAQRIEERKQAAIDAAKPPAKEPLTDPMKEPDGA